MSERLRGLADGAGGPPQRGFSSWIGGRARRREYWLWVAGVMVLAVVLSALKMPGATLFAGLPILFAWIRRLHDLGYSGWFAPVIDMGVNVAGFAALGFLPQPAAGAAAALLYLAALVIMGVLPGQPARNEYGQPHGKPLATEVFS
jgi:uncharacterized membrane protein YhaH (DUF805 family)